jgi:hypothetical protein
MNDTVVHLAVSNPEKLLEILSHREMAAQEFEPVPQLAGPKAATFEELKKHQDRLEEFGVIVRMALGILGQTKAKLIEFLEGIDEDGGIDAVEVVIKDFANGAEQGETLVHFLRSAQLRLTVAMHNVYPDDGSVLPAEGGAA